MSREELTQILEEFGTLLDLKGANPFKVRAFQNGARAVATYPGSIEDAAKADTLLEIKGIGASLASLIKEYFESGNIKEYQELKNEFPPGVLEMLRVPGVGPKKVRALFEKLHITGVGELEYACRENRLINLEGFGEKTQSKILQGIEQFKKYKESFLYPDAKFEADLLVSFLKKSKDVLKIDVGGSLRRKKEIVKDIDLVVSTKAPAKVTERFLKYPGIETVIGSGETKTSIKLKSGINCDLRVMSPKEYPFALVYFTGNKEHNTVLRSIAKNKSLKLNEYGLFKGEKRIPCSNEKDVYEALGLSYIEPELRENMGEIEAAQNNQLPQLVVEDELKGLFHCHTTESDGSNSLEEMVRGAEKLGFEYIGISDHSKSSVYANGLNEKRLLDQFEAIEQLQKKVKIKILKGVEADILADGRLDFDNEFLRRFDFVIGSLHSGFSQKQEQLTKRVFTALENPYMDILGHPTGRLLLGREAYPLDMVATIEKASQTKTIVELNASPHRLDVDWRYHQVLRKTNVMVSINPDAHSVPGLEDVVYGIGVARKAWLGKVQILNCLPAKEVVKKLKRNLRT